MKGHPSLSSQPIDEEGLHREAMEERHEPFVTEVQTDSGPVKESSSIRRAWEVKKETLGWLWRDRIPFGKVTVLAGPADSGKSFVAVDLAARVSRGDKWPDQPAAPHDMAEILYVCTNSDAADTLIPRLEAAKADMDNIHVLSGVTRRGAEVELHDKREFSFPDDLPRVEHALANMEAAELIIIDSLTDFCSSRSREAKMLKLLNELVAGHPSLAIVVLTNSGGKCDQAGRFQGLKDWANSPVRSAWGIAEDPDKLERKLFLPARMNYAPTTGLEFRIAEGGVKWLPLGDLPMSRAAREVKRVTEWLKELLGTGSMPVTEIEEQAEECGYSLSTLRTARENLEIKPRKEGFGKEGRWVWSLESAAPTLNFADLQPSEPATGVARPEHQAKGGAGQESLVVASPVRRGSPPIRRGSPDPAAAATEGLPTQGRPAVGGVSLGQETGDNGVVPASAGTQGSDSPNPANPPEGGTTSPAPEVGPAKVTIAPHVSPMNLRNATNKDQKRARLALRLDEWLRTPSHARPMPQSQAVPTVVDRSHYKKKGKYDK